MTTFWPKRDKDGRHMSEPRPLSELLAKLDPDVVEQALADIADELKCAECDGKGYIVYPMNGAVMCECCK